MSKAAQLKSKKCIEFLLSAVLEIKEFEILHWALDWGQYCFGVKWRHFYWLWLIVHAFWLRLKLRFRVSVWIFGCWSLTKPVSIFNFKSACRVSISLNRTKELHLDVLIDVLFARKVATKLISTSIKAPWNLALFPFRSRNQNIPKNLEELSPIRPHINILV